MSASSETRDNASEDTLILALTTAPSKESAEAIARRCINEGLAACVQIDSRCDSFYSWKGETHSDPERRVWLKAIASLEKPLKKAVFDEHPYEAPQWIVFKAESADEKYLKWAREVSNLRGFL